MIVGNEPAVEAARLVKHFGPIKAVDGISCEVPYGTYFPLDRLPLAMRCALWLIPLTSVVDVIRALVSGSGTAWFTWKLFYVLATTVVFLEIAMRSLARRLIR